MTPVKSLSEFTERVHTCREKWNRPHDKELWFRGESLEYRRKKTFLRPGLYRSDRKRTIDELLKIDSDQHDNFQLSAVQLSIETMEDEYWDWDSYFLMQHHSVPTRLLDWSDGALIALHFAIYSRADNKCEHCVVYVLDPDKLKDMPKSTRIEREWRTFVRKHPHEDYSEFEWETAYLPCDKKERKKIEMPLLPSDPVVLNIPHITRRVAAQRSRFIIFGRDGGWLADKFGKPGSMEEIVIDGNSKEKIKVQLRDSGITESVIFPDLDGLGRELKQLWELRT